ncbi:Leucine-rich repeat serine/threonine-protein kinase 2 [Phytophthora boehmeriae]|uniref:Leucine-rich repeat serine/threonine-protein kinase 2 n=1 Tax=Phytophthora boehmeriae TaxID=109152 RepID=A0A8T1W0H4_9STRA|nr:Leucine-rich repeat serine/threonine-protein kinase 2 [Phytophthora boehmeriae]
MTLWEDRIDPYEDKQSRWHSLNINLVRTRDLLGDTFVSELREAARDHRDQRLLVAWSNTLRTQLEEYEAEERLLIKLATTGRVVKILQGAIKQAVEILKLHENASDWIEELSQEREARIDLYETLSKSNFCQLAGEVQDENQQLEVLTVLKHGLEKHGDVLTPRELDMISAVFDWVVRLSGIVIGPIPEWFTVPTFDLEWSFSDSMAPATLVDLSLSMERATHSETEWL